MKNRFVTKSLLVLMVSALVITLSSNSFAQRGPRPNNPNRDSARFERGIPNLTADQKAKIESLKVKHLKEVTPLRNELAEKKAHLITLESAEKPDKDAVNKTIDEISVLHGKIMKSGVNHRMEVASNLTDEQKVFFNARHNSKGRGQMGMGQGNKNRMRNRMGNGVGNGNCPNYQNCPNKR